ncbi:hypothetical protein H4582DRAFT_1426820 [Lactarius indigo]|nr:hypothetical protein H4582DRAFT_1426820 [Lactarius indigo]
MPLHPSPHCDRPADHHYNYNLHYLPSHVPGMECDAGRRYSGAQRHRRENLNGASNSPCLSPRSPHSPYPIPYHHGRSKFHQKPPPSFLDGGNSGELSAAAIDEPLLSPPSSRQRHSMPDVVYTHGPRLPSSVPYGTAAMHGARARFVSLPTIVNANSGPYPPLLSLPLPRFETTECDRLERACGRVPAALLRVRDDPPPSSPHQPRGDGAPPPPAPKWPHWTLVLRIKRALRRDGKDVRDYVEAAQIDELFQRDVEERARREREHARIARVRAGKEPAGFDENARVFGVPLNESVLRAPATAILGGFRHDLPLVVFLCVEELYRTGIYKSGLFRDLPNRQRHHELRTLFDTPPAFGEGMNLRAESTADICALLLTYLNELPEPVLTPYLFNAFWNWCVRPSVKREDERTRKEQDEEEDLRARFFQTGQRPPRPSRRVLFEKARLRAAQDESAETGQVAVARDLLRLLPTHSFSLIVYLCAFFTQVPLCPENGIALEDIGRIFGPSVFGGPVPAARRMMVWFLKRWNRVSDGLLDPDPDDPSSGSSSTGSSASARKSGRDARMLERADSFELLAPEKDYEEELDFRAVVVDPLDECRRRASYNPLFAHCDSEMVKPPGDGLAGWPTAAIPTTLSDPSDKEREYSLEPDDSISQVPSLSDGRSNSPAGDDVEANGEELLPPHVFASVATRWPSMSSASQYGTGGELPHRANCAR